MKKEIKTFAVLFLLLISFMIVSENYCQGMTSDFLISQELVYDDYGKIITEDEIQKYMNPDVFWYTLKNMGASTVAGMAIGVIYAITTNNTGWGLIGYGVGGGILGLWLGLGYSSTFPPNKITRSEAINLIRQNRHEERKRIDRY